MNHWDQRFMRMAVEARTWVKGPDTGVGALIVSADRREFSPGYSGLPRGIEDLEARIVDPEFKDFAMVHAEANAIYNSKWVVAGGTLYSTTSPCAHCCAAIIQSDIARVVCPPVSVESRWLHSQKIGRELLFEAGILVEEMALSEAYPDE